MINIIIDIFKNQAREHKVIKAFYYNKNYELGTGKEIHPLFWLEDPITGTNQSNMFRSSVNFSILFVPGSNDNISNLQSICFSIGLNIIERIKANRESIISINPDWTFMTLRDYYDNNACGCRFSVNLNIVNMQNLCLIEDQFDPNKQFEDNSILPNFDLKTSDGCDIFTNKLPVFDLKTSK